MMVLRIKVFLEEIMESYWKERFLDCITYFHYLMYRIGEILENCFSMYLCIYLKASIHYDTSNHGIYVYYIINKWGRVI